MIKLLLLFVILQGCSKGKCFVETKVPVSWFCPDSIKFIEVHFFQGERIVGADVVYGSQFVNGTFSLTYYFYDTDPDLMVWRVYQVDRKWVEYKTDIR